MFLPNCSRKRGNFAQEMDEGFRQCSNETVDGYVSYRCEVVG